MTASTETTPDAGAGFPVRVAAVDIGSNAIRFTATEFREAGRRVELENRRAPVRLGHSAFRTGRLDASKLRQAVEAMVEYRRRLDALEVRAYRAVATSAVRDSRNGSELVERARREADIRIETITGAEEARLVWVAVRDRFPAEGRWLLVDLGGGSLEVSVVGDAGTEWSESHPLGTVRMLDELGGADPTDAEVGRLLADHASALTLPRVGADGLRGLIAAGGNIEALADLAGAPTDGAGVSRLSVRALESTTDRLAARTNAERISEFDLREDRADVIVPAGRIYLRVAEGCGAEELVVPRVGVREGVLLDLVGDVSG